MSAELIPELQRLGKRLQQARQAQGISLNDQAERLHMGSEQLRALEEGNQDELPEAVFVVAQARRVATSLGLNIDDDIAALRGNQTFQALPTQRRIKPQASGPSHNTAPHTAPQPRAVPPTAPLRLLGLAAAVLAAAGLAWGLQRSLSGARPAPQATDSSQPSTVSTAAANPVEPQGQSAEAELVLRSAEPSWLEVRAPAGELLFRGTLTGEQRFPLTGELQVLAGRPDLVTAARGASPGRPLGPIEAITWYRFSPEFNPAEPSAPAP